MENIQADLNRIHEWALNEQGSFYRQNLIFSSFRTVEMRSATRRFCRNANGAIELSRSCDGVLSRLLESTRQVFQRVPKTDQDELSLVVDESSSSSSEEEDLGNISDAAEDLPVSVTGSKKKRLAKKKSKQNKNKMIHSKHTISS